MGGGKKPGDLYIVEVQATPTELILTGDKFDPSYFAKGGKFVAVFTPYCGDYSGADKSETQPGS